MVKHIKCIPNALSDTLIKDVKKFVADTEFKRTSYGSWSSNLRNASPPIISTNLPNEVVNYIVSELKLEGKFTGCYHQMPKLSYIAWHDDGSRGERRAVTIYLNEYWDENWGGCFAFKSEESIQCFKPTYNTALVVPSGVHHSVFSTTMDAPVRESIQLFELRSNEMGDNGS